MNSEDSNQTQDDLLRHSQLAALTASLIKELRKEQSNNPETIIINERIRGIQSKLEDVLQQKEYLVMDYSNLQSLYSDLSISIEKEIEAHSSSIIQKFDDYSNSSKIKISDLLTRINNVNHSLKQANLNKETINNQKILIEKSQRDIESLSEDNDALFKKINENNQKYQKELNQKNNEIVKLNEAIENFQEEIRQLQENKTNFDTDYAEVQQRLIAELGLKDKLNTELLELKETTENQKHDIETKSEQIKNLENQLNDCKTKIEALTSSEEKSRLQLENERKFYIEQQLSGENHSKELLKSLEDSKNQIKDELDQKNIEIESLKKAQINLLNEIESLKNIKDEKEEYKANLISASNENQNMKIEIESLRNTILQLKTTNKELNEKAQNSEKDYYLRIKEMEQKHKEEKDSENQLYSDKINGMNLDSEHKQNEIDNLKVELDNLKISINGLNNLNANLETELNNAKKENEKLTAESNKVSEEYNSTLLQLEDYKAKFMALNDQKDSINLESEKNKNKVDELAQDNHKLENQLQALNDKIRQMETELKNKDVEIDLLRSSGETKKSKLNEQLIQSSKEINELKAETNELKAEINRLQNVESELQEMQILLETKAGIEKQNEELIEQNKVLLFEHQDLVSITGEFNIAIYDLRNFFENTKSEKIKLERNLEEKNKSINELQKALRETEEAASKQMTEYENVVDSLSTSHIAEIDRITGEYNQNINNLKDENKELKEKNDNHIKELMDLNEKLNILSESVNANDEKQNLINQLDEKNKENENLRELIQKLQEEKPLSLIKQENDSIEINRLNNEIQLRVKEINDLKQAHQYQIEEIEDRFNGLSLRNNELENNLTEVNNENVVLKNQVNDAQTFLSIIGPLNGQIFDLRSNLQVSADRVRQMQKDNRSLKFEVQRLNNEIVYLNSTLDEKKDMLKAFKEKQEEMEKISNTKVTELKTGITKMFEELEERKRHDEDLSRVLHEKQQMLKVIGLLEEQIYEQFSELNIRSTAILNLRKEIDGYLNEIGRMKLEAQNADEIIQNLYKQVSEAREEGEEAKKMNGTMNLKIAQLNEVNNSLNDKISSLEKLNSSLLKDKDELLLFNKELDSQMQISSKEKEMYMIQLGQRQEVDDVIEIVRSKLNKTIKENSDYQNENRLIKEENKRLLEIIEKSTPDQKTIQSLELEKIELESRVALLEGQLQLRAVQMKDSVIAELEKKIEELQDSAESEKLLQEKVSILEEENSKLRSERDALDLRSNELEANTASMDDLQSALDKCEKLEDEARKRENEIEKIQTERNAIDLKYEELSNELEAARNQIKSIEEDNHLLKQKEEELQKYLAESELKLTNTNAENLQGKKESLQLKKRISELELITSSITEEKENLEKKNKSQIEEIEDLSRRIFNLTASSSNIVVNNTNPNLKSPYKMISDKSNEISELKKTIKSLEDQLSSESAEHLNTKKEMDKQFRALNESERHLRDTKTYFDGLVKSLTDIFLCKPNIASIIAAAAECKAQSQIAHTLYETLGKAKNDVIAARREPNYLKQKLNNANMLLDIEKRKNIVMTAKVDNNINIDINNIDSAPLELPSINKSENVSLDMSEYKACCKSFLVILFDSKEIPSGIQNIISNLLYKAEIPENRDFFDESSWISLARAITSCFYKYRANLYNMNQKVVGMMSEIGQHVDDVQKRISMLPIKCNSISLKQAKNVNIENKTNNNPYTSHIPRIATSSLNDRQSKTPIQSAFQSSEFDRQTPGKSNWKSSITPINSQKKQETPFRTPLGELSNSTMNISFGTETPKITMHRNTMSKIPVHFMPSGVLPPKSRNYH